MLEYLYEESILHNSCRYHLNRGKRQYIRQQPHKNKTLFEFEGFMNCPTHLYPTVWKRYEYSLEDMVTTYQQVDAAYIWQMALMLMMETYEPEAGTNDVRATFQGLTSFLFNSKKKVFDNFLSHQKQFSEIGARSVSVLCQERPDHVPLLPKITLELETFNQLRRWVPQRPPSFCYLVVFPGLLQWRGAQYVPLEYDEVHQLLYLVRIMLWADYEALPFKPRPCAVTLPVKIEVENKKEGTLTQYVLLSEACFAKKGKRSGSNKNELSLPRKKVKG